MPQLGAAEGLADGLADGGADAEGDGDGDVVADGAAEGDADAEGDGEPVGAALADGSGDAGSGLGLPVEPGSAVAGAWVGAVDAPGSVDGVAEGDGVGVGAGSFGADLGGRPTATRRPSAVRRRATSSDAFAQKGRRRSMYSVVVVLYPSPERITTVRPGRSLNPEGIVYRCDVRTLITRQPPSR